MRRYLFLYPLMSLMLLVALGASEERRWDINEDNVVNIFDLVLVGQHFGETDEENFPPWDVNGDGVVNIFDLVEVAGHFGEMYPEQAPIALPGLPDEVAGYETWVKLNAEPIPPRAADPHNGTKNVYVNPEGAEIAANGQFPYPDGTIVVKESVRPNKDFIGLIAIMQKANGSNPAHNDWMFVEYIRSNSDDAFREIASGAVCTGCHSGAANTDYVWTRFE